jgi:hypothetical protein
MCADNNSIVQFVIKAFSEFDLNNVIGTGRNTHQEDACRGLIEYARQVVLVGFIKRDR